jgi:hypothetical protein
MNNYNSIGFADLSEVFPYFKQTVNSQPKITSTSTFTSSKPISIPISLPKDDPPAYEEPKNEQNSELNQELNVILNLKPYNRIRRINNKIVLDTRKTFMRRFTGDSRVKALEDIKRISKSIQLKSYQKQQFKACLEILANTTYKNDALFKKEIESVIV